MFNLWKIVINEQDGLGGGKNKDVFFENYDDAHSYYEWINSLHGTPFYPHVVQPPHPAELTVKIWKKGEWKRPK